MKSKTTLTALAVTLFCCLIASTAAAALFSGIVAFGDSLSDTGNVYAATAGSNPPAPYYYDGRYSNGPVWVEYLATFVSDNALENYAWGGAVTGLGGLPPGLLTQVGGYAASAPGDLDETLFTVWAGPNDFFNGSDDYEGAVKNIINALETLDGLGAQHILVPNMPDLGKTPYLYNDALASGLSLAFNTTLQAALDDFAIGFGGSLYRLDTFSILNGIQVGDYGFANISESCLAANPYPASWLYGDDFLFWDDVHPTTKAHMILALEAQRIVSAPVPLPASLWILGSGLTALAAVRRKQRS